MIPSIVLQSIISKNHKLNLKKLAWSKELQDRIFDIKFKDTNYILSLKTVFEHGYNIGNCLLTSYYVSQVFENAKICTGMVKILKGTKNTLNGEHVWIETDTDLIDTTLMIIIPKSHKYFKLYNKESNIIPQFTLDELNFQKEIYQRQRFPDQYYLELYKT